MGVRFYDEAVVKVIESWVKDPNLRILKPDESTRLFEMMFDENKDQPLMLPIIAISRDKQIEIQNVNKQAKTFQGITVSRDVNGNVLPTKNISFDAVPIQISYQIDIYTRWLAEADEYVRNFVFNFINYPKLTVNIPYQKINLEHVCNMNLDSVISDNSDIKEKLIADQFTRFTLKITIEDAYFFSLPLKEAAQFKEIQLDLTDRTEHEVIETEKVI